MKFLHTADVHLGAAPDAGKAYSENRSKEIWNSFAAMVKICEEAQVDLLLIAGDLFHRQPLVRELKEINYLFAGLTRTKVVFIAGNHDYIKPDSYYLNFDWNENVYPLLNEQLGYVEFPDINTCVYGFSYYQKEIAEKRLLHQRREQRQPFEILLAHGGDDKHVPFKREELKALGYHYIALGHIHKPQELDHSIRFSGAPEPLDKNDTGLHGYIFGELGKQGLESVFVPAAVREYKHLLVSVDEKMTGHALRERIQESIEEKGVQNIYKVVVEGFRDPDILFDLEQMDVYGNILEIIDETRPSYDFEKLANKNSSNLLGKFIREWQNCEPDSIESQALYEGVQAVLKTKRG